MQQTCLPGYTDLYYVNVIYSLGCGHTHIYRQKVISRSQYCAWLNNPLFDSCSYI